MTKPTRQPSYVVAAVAKALHTLRAFVDRQDRWGVRELGSSLGLPPSTIHRLLYTLKSEGFVAQAPDEQEYTIGFEFTRLAAAVMQRNNLNQVASPIMRELSENTGESVWLALYDDDTRRVAYISEIESSHASRYIAPLGRAETLTDSACGIAILASLANHHRQETLQAVGSRMTPDKLLALDAARHSGYAILRSTEVESAMMVAAIINDAKGNCVGSLGIVVPLHRFGDGQGKLYGEQVQQACWRISASLGARFLGGSSSGTWGDAIGLINQILLQHLPRVSVAPALGGGARNLEALGKGLGAYGLTTSSSLFDAYHGRGPFVRPLNNLRSIMSLSELHLLLIARKDAHLRSMADLAELRVSPGEQGFSAALIFDDLSRYLRRTHAIPGKGPNLFFLSYPEGKRHFEAGTIDALCWLSGLENPLVRELEEGAGARLLTLEDDTLDQFVGLNPGYHRSTIAQSVLPRWLASDTPMLCVRTVLVCAADRPEEEVYELTRALFEQRENLAQMSSVYHRLDKDFASEALTAPRHPGAARFFSELADI